MKARRAPRAHALDMRVSRLTIDPLTNMPIVLLTAKRGPEALPIGIGLTEASAIAAELENIALERPMTHDLMKNIIGECGVTVDHVEVHDVRDDVFYATIHLVGPDGRAMGVDARPSDAIALALRTGARITVQRKVLARVRARGGDLAEEPLGPPVEVLEHLSDEAFGKWKM